MLATQSTVTYELPAAEMARPKTFSHQQGHSTLAILTNIGDHYPVISDVGYHVNKNAAAAPLSLKKGSRPMHRTTFTLEKNPSQPEFITSSKLSFGGSKHLAPGCRPLPFPSLHESQFNFHHIGSRPNHSMAFDTHYKRTYHEKDVIPANRLHLVSVENCVNMNDGGGMRRVHKYPDFKPNYWSQYDRIHSTLGRMLGPGVPRERPVRQHFHVLTGELRSPAWSEENRRISGNRVLSAARGDESSQFVLG
ncbi:uncharacterized protein LOC135497235 [Lineus longissimus]|uniref:uncharacterized protein LOC135497235 n=1 Tax=Lineus longissimus TaxID=88925 RepID=UPI002B4ED6A4